MADVEQLSGTGLIATGITLVTAGANVAQSGDLQTGIVMIGAGGICVLTGVYLMQKGITKGVIKNAKVALGIQ
jgi:hypothetical protein